MSEGGDKRFCENCGTEINQTANFCPNCGAAQRPNPELPTGPPPRTPEPGRISTPDAPGVPPPPSQERSRRRFGDQPGYVKVVVVVFALIVLAAIGEAIGGGKRDSSSQGASTTQEEASSPSQKQQQGTSAPQEPAPINLSGSGQMVTDSFDLQSGLAVFEMSYQGQQNFIVHLLDESGKDVGMSLANEIGSFEGSEARQTRAGRYVLDVQASGPWSITIEQPRPSSAPQSTSFNGSGKTATKPFRLASGLKRFDMTHQGERNFIVHLLDKNGKEVGASLVNEIGPFNGSKAVRVPGDDIYLLQVQADGPWAIQVG